jgi:large subunit ribosomal protein L19
MKRIAQLEKSYMRDDFPPFKSGDTLRVHVKIKEGEKERIQVFQGTVIGHRGSGTNATFTVRKISSGIGVERIFPFHSPNIAKIEKIRAGQVRRKKLYYLRELTGQSARIKEQLNDPSEAAKNAPEKVNEPVVEKTDAPDTTETPEKTE